MRLVLRSCAFYLLFENVSVVRYCDWKCNIIGWAIRGWWNRRRCILDGFLQVLHALSHFQNVLVDCVQRWWHQIRTTRLLRCWRRWRQIVDAWWVWTSVSYEIAQWYLLVIIPMKRRLYLLFMKLLYEELPYGEGNEFVIVMTGPGGYW